MEFLPDFGLDAENRRDHDETTEPEPQPGFQGKGGARRNAPQPAATAINAPTKNRWSELKTE
ncbi:hypothetical protein [Ciceribacter sichuanensis]|uniref:hypothetical protein n=1 Tax=Ciceribacter sichuanensis TaxID=2949647 RepID=UPI0020343DC9|nr:hypothetical protein [Ciceribacter sp. S153]